MAFSPDLPALTGVSLLQREIPYPAFVVSVPRMYKKDFESNYHKILTTNGLYGMEMAIRCRKLRGNFCQFTICCRGTLSQCQRLEALLTPTIEFEGDDTVSMAKMKERKTETMKMLLEDVFGFKPPPLSNRLHARSVSGYPEVQNRDGDNNGFAGSSSQQLSTNFRHYSNKF